MQMLFDLLDHLVTEQVLSLKVIEYFQLVLVESGLLVRVLENGGETTYKELLE